MEGLELAVRDNAAKGRDSHEYDYNRTERVIEAIILCCIASAALIGNTSLWVIILRSKRLKTQSNYLILCLSTADILVSAINMPVAVYTILAGDWEFSHASCVVLGFTTMLTFIASVMSLGAISINRYVMVCHPRKLYGLYTNRRTGFWIAGVWTLSFVLATPPLLGWAEYNYLPGQSFCFCNWPTSISYTFFMVVACFGGPFTTMTFCYINILREVRQSKRRVARSQKRPRSSERRDVTASSATDTESELRTPPGSASSEKRLTPKAEHKGRFYRITSLLSSPSKNPTPTKENNNSGIKYTMSDIDGLASRPSPRSPNPDDGQSMISNSADDPALSAAKRRREKAKAEELRLTTTLFVVIVIFTICWFPFCITMFISVFDDKPVPRIPDIATMLLGCLNSSLNPIIYGLMNKKFRSGFATLYCWSCRKIKRIKSQTSSSLHKSSSSNTQ